MAKRVILIEDDLDLQRIYSSKIESAGFEVLLALEATQGWNLVKGEKPNIILLDIMLPGKMNGFDFLKKLKEGILTRHESAKHTIKPRES